MNTDYDKEYALWFDGIPYWWAPLTRERFYIVDLKAAAFFDDQGCIGNPSPHTNNRWSFYPENINDQQAMAMLYTPNVDISNCEVRINGAPIFYDPQPATFPHNLVKIVGHGNLLTYPWRFGDLASNEHEGIANWISFENRKFRNLASMVNHLQIPWEQVSDIHDNAQRRRNGYCYEWTDRDYYGEDNWATSQIIFEMVYGVRVHPPIAEPEDVAPVYQENLPIVNGDEQVAFIENETNLVRDEDTEQDVAPVANVSLHDLCEGVIQDLALTDPSNISSILFNLRQRIKGVPRTVWADPTPKPILIAVDHVPEQGGSLIDAPMFVNKADDCAEAFDPEDLY